MTESGQKIAKQRAFGFGWRAESRAAWMLRLKGYRILARRMRTPAGEIDLVARRGPVLAVVEVKARPTLSQGLEALSPAQQQRLVRAGSIVLGKMGSRAKGGDLTLRFDLVVVRPWRWPHHLQGAWRA
ncbi:MAG: YraN family protein [Magnetovibrionaceae bacterium]